MSRNSSLHDQKPGALLSFPSFAKVNLCLEILGRRNDGFHEVRTLLQTIDLRDEISVRATTGQIHLSLSGRTVDPGEGNTVWRAVRIFSQHCGLTAGLAITLHKRIPVGAGLGGGSSNAAVTLLALNQVTGRHLSLPALTKMAAEIGSDVPFFLEGGLAFGWGRGERIVPLKESNPEGGLVVVYPGFEVPTKEAYAEHRPGLQGKAELLTSEHPDTTIRRFRGVLDSRSWSGFRNDLEQPVLNRHPKMRKVVAVLRESGCDFVGMSGSGSTLFGTGSNPSLEKAEQACVSQKMGEVFRTRFVSARRYRRSLQQAGLALPEYACG